MTRSTVGFTNALYWHSPRWYNPKIGRWISEDPVGLYADSNPHRYAGNSPTYAIDTTGLEDAPVQSLAVNKWGFVKSKSDFSLSKPQMGKVGFKDWRWLGDFGPFPDNVSQVWVFQDITRKIKVYDKDGQVVAIFTGRIFDSMPSSVKSKTHNIVFTDIQESVDGPANDLFSAASDVGLKCDRYTIRYESAVSIVGGVDLKIKDKGWLQDDGTKYHDNKAMIVSTFATHLAATQSFPEINRSNSPSVEDARPHDNVYFGPLKWTLDVNGHFDAKSQPVVDDGKIDFSGFKPKSFVEGLDSPIYEYKAKDQ